MGPCGSGLNGAPPVPYSCQRAGLRSCLLVPGVASWPVEYNSGVGDPRVGGFQGLGCCLLGIRKVRASGLPGCSVMAVRKMGKMSLTRAVCAARASFSVWMAGDTCPAANVRIWWIGKTRHKLFEVGRPAVPSWGGMTSACCWPSTTNRGRPHRSLHLVVQLPPDRPGVGMGPAPRLGRHANRLADRAPTCTQTWRPDARYPATECQRPQHPSARGPYVLGKQDGQGEGAKTPDDDGALRANGRAGGTHAASTARHPQHRSHGGVGTLPLLPGEDHATTAGKPLQLGGR